MKHVFYEHIEILNRQPWGQWRWSTPRNIQVSKFKYYQCVLLVVAGLVIISLGIGLAWSRYPGVWRWWGTIGSSPSGRPLAETLSNTTQDNSSDRRSNIQCWLAIILRFQIYLCQFMACLRKRLHCSNGLFTLLYSHTSLFLFCFC